MNKDTLPEGFTLSLAIVDALPVLFFCASMIVVGVLFKSIMEDYCCVTEEKYLVDVSANEDSYADWYGYNDSISDH